MLLSCNTAAALPTYTPYPTHTPYPTYTPYPAEKPAPSYTADTASGPARRLDGWTFGIDSFTTLEDNREYRVFTLSLISSSGGAPGQDGYIPGIINLECSQPENERDYLSVHIAWLGVISTDPPINDALQASIRFDDGEWVSEEWFSPPEPPINVLYAPQGYEAAYIRDFMRHDRFRFEIERGDGSVLWNEWNLSGLSDLIDQPQDLCKLLDELLGEAP